MSSKHTVPRLDPAASILAKLGGANFVANKVLRVNPSIVYRFMYPKEHEGRDGWIPREYHDTLLAWANEHRIELARSEFYEAPSASADKDAA